MVRQIEWFAQSFQALIPETHGCISGAEQTASIDLTDSWEHMGRVEGLSDLFEHTCWVP